MSIRNLIRAVQILTWLMARDTMVPTDINKKDGKYHTFQNIFLPRPNLFDRTIADKIKSTKYLMKSALIMSVTITYMLQVPGAGHVAMGRCVKDLRR